MEIYIIGSVIAIIMSAVDAYHDKSDGRDYKWFFRDFGAIGLISWVYVILVAGRFVYDKLKNNKLDVKNIH